MKLLKKLDTTLAKIMKIVGLGCLLGLFLILMANVFFRWVPILQIFPNFSMGWFDEIVEMLFAWMIMTTSSILCRDKAHFKVDLIQTKFKDRKWMPWFNLIIDLISLVFLVALFYYSAKLTAGARQLTQEMHIQKRWFYLCMPINSFIMSCYTLRDMAQDFLEGIGKKKAVVA